MRSLLFPSSPVKTRACSTEYQADSRFHTCADNASDKNFNWLMRVFSYQEEVATRKFNVIEGLLRSRDPCYIPNEESQVDHFLDQFDASFFSKKRIKAKEISVKRVRGGSSEKIRRDSKVHETTRGTFRSPGIKPPRARSISMNTNVVSIRAKSSSTMVHRCGSRLVPFSRNFIISRSTR